MTLIEVECEKTISEISLAKKNWDSNFSFFQSLKSFIPVVKHFLTHMIKIVYRKFFCFYHLFKDIFKGAMARLII